MRNRQIVIGGVGGQGVLFITGLLARACMAEGNHVLTSETHGMAQRGGSVISHLKTGDFMSPLVRPGRADILVALKPESYVQHETFLKTGGLAVVNSEEAPVSPHDRHLVTVDADRLSREENTGSVNLFLIGALLAKADVCSFENVCEQMTVRLGGKNPQTVAKALHALERGFEIAGKEK